MSIFVGQRLRGLIASGPNGEDLNVATVYTFAAAAMAAARGAGSRI